MARVPSTKARTTPKRASANGDMELRKRVPVEYNVSKLSEKSAAAPKAPAPAPKAAAKAGAKKSGAAKKVGKKVNYVTLIKRALKEVDVPGWGVEKIVKFLEANYGKDNRRYIRLALASGVEQKIFVKARQTYRLSKKAHDKLTRGDKKKKSSTKKSTKKSASKKSTTKKSATKKSTTKKIRHQKIRHQKVRDEKAGHRGRVRFSEGEESQGCDSAT